MDLIGILAAMPTDEAARAEDNIRLYLAVGAMSVGILAIVSAANGAWRGVRQSRVLFALVVGTALVLVGLWIFDRTKYIWGL